MQAESAIVLIDNTLVVPPSDNESHRSPSVGGHLSLTQLLSRGSARQRRKYAKWQPDKLGLNVDGPVSRVHSRASSYSHTARERPSSDWDLDTDGSVSRGEQDEEHRKIDTTDFGRTETDNCAEGPSKTVTTTVGAKSHLDVLYENQRGSFFFGIPLYSHKSLLNLDPAPWVGYDLKDSPVDITNAQVPDPSWEWAWKTWYVDMSGDVDEEGWEYSFSFSATKAWHGTHPWFHSFVRRRRWVRLRAKKAPRRTDKEGRTVFEMAHMFNEDYFTIHSTLVNVRSREPSIGPGSTARASQVHKIEEEEYHFEEIGDIPALMQAVKRAVVDREKLDALKRFVQEGGEELHYLPSKIPEIMSLFIFQTSRWQFYTYLQGLIEEESKDLSEKDKSAEADAKRRRINNLSKAAESVKSNTTGPDVFSHPSGASASSKLDLTPASGPSSVQVKQETVSATSETGSTKDMPKQAGID